MGPMITVVETRSKVDMNTAMPKAAAVQTRFSKRRSAVNQDGWK